MTINLEQATAHQGKDLSIVDGEKQKFARTTKEYIFLRVNNPDLTNHIGKYNLLPIWDGVLLSTPEIKVTNHQNTKNSGHTI